MLFRRREIPWEVVDSRSVDPVPMYYEDEDLEIAAIKDSTVRRMYAFDVKCEGKHRGDLHKAVIFARDQLLQEMNKNGYNILLLESWRVTILRKGKRHRVEVEYSGRPARALNKVLKRQPPFMAVLQHHA
ncbi:hypothetical protein NLJ89_g5958 [Agrocybe chaxingu]|uniref:Uncharacterized protein n=1 Tax=Agrocybe chaxingu TaxID=84603 RepID=A0A9W8JXE9_9AGAR|nr:hypothetical protein NLJ89_g5958 [Agrocybe chaxingu]